YYYVYYFLFFFDIFVFFFFFFFFSSRRRHTRSYGDWSSDVCSSDLFVVQLVETSDKPFVAQGEEMQIFVPRYELTNRLRREQNRSEERRVGKECRYRGWRDH